MCSTNEPYTRSSTSATANAGSMTSVAPCTRPEPSCSSARSFSSRTDVLVAAQDVVRVVAALELDQAVVLGRAVRGADAVQTLVLEEVHVGATACVRLQRGVAVAHPPH